MFIPQIELIDLDAGDQFMLDCSDLINVENQRFRTRREISFTPTISNAKIVSFLRPFSDSVGAHEPVAAVQPPRARDDDHAARPRGCPRPGNSGGAALREGGPGGCARKKIQIDLYISVPGV